MATITKRKGGWNVQVRRKGYASRSRTFPSKSEASAWGREQERLMDLGRLPTSTAILKVTSVDALLRRYAETVTVSKRSADTEVLRLRNLQRDALGAISLADLETKHIAAYRDRRLRLVKPGTVRRELYLLASAIDVATKEWGFPLMANPARLIAFPVANDARDRRLEDGEAEKLHKALSNGRNPFVKPIVLLAIETGLRRREVLELTWSNIDLERRIAYIPTTKTGVPRTIPLTDAALALLKGLDAAQNCSVKAPADDRLFPVSVNAFKQAWKRVQQRSGLSDFRFHDLRHEALSRFCELGLTLPELAVISGHKDPRMLFRYAHLRADDLARKLAGRDWSSQRLAQQGVAA